MTSELSSHLDAASAYDRIAGVYDDQVQGGQWMRGMLWESYQRRFTPGQCLLDLSCGTGIDALFLAQLGFRVVGIDISARMIEQLEMKAKRLNLSDRVQAYVRDITDLHPWSPPPFDGIISAFAGLSTLPDLTDVASDAHRLLKPGGYFIIHMLNRAYPRERLGLIRHGQWANARDTMKRRTIAPHIGGIPVQHYLYRPGEVYRRFFKQRFHLRHVYGMGILRPPNPPRWLSPSVLNLLGRLDRSASGRYPFYNWGQFFVLELQKKDVDQSLV
jgi:ubiquinone/menaquinone biosynthesis C-methylase UbiE